MKRGDFHKLIILICMVILILIAVHALAYSGILNVITGGHMVSVTSNFANQNESAPHLGYCIPILVGVACFIVAVIYLNIRKR